MTFQALTLPTQRMIAKSLYGELVEVRLRTGGDPLRLEVIGLASPQPEGRKTFESLLIGRDYYTRDLQAVPLKEVTFLRPWERFITDPDHPDFEHPGRVVRPKAPR